MDRTSILGDTIDYMKELIEKIKHMQEEMAISSNDDQLNSLNGKSKETYIRNSPKVSTFTYIHFSLQCVVYSLGL